MKQNVEYERFMHSMKVISVNGEMHIGIRDKMFDSVFNMYLSRYRQHKHGETIYSKECKISCMYCTCIIVKQLSMSDSILRLLLPNAHLHISIL